MRIKETIAIMLLILGTVGTVWAIFAYEDTRRSQGPIELLAQIPDKGNWTPRTLHVEKGQPVNLMIRNIDVVTHGFYLPAFDIVVREIKAGEIEYVNFTPEESGTYPFYCAIWCSDYHMSMRGSLVVE